MGKSEILQNRRSVNVIEVHYKNMLKRLTPIQCRNNIYVVSDDFKDWSSVNKDCHRYIFRNSELKYNILNSVPVHTYVSSGAPKGIPIILSYDPVVRRMNFKPGDVLDIEGRTCVVD